LQFSATLINLAQYGRFVHENQAHKVNLPKWANSLRQLLGNQIDRGTAIDFRVSHTASPVATGGFGGLSPPNWNMKTINEWSFVNFYNVKSSTGKQKTHSNHNVGWFSPRDYVVTTPAWVEITRGWYSRGVSNRSRKLESDQCRQVLPIVGSWHVNLVLFCVDGGQVLQRCLISKFMSSIKYFDILPQVHAQQVWQFPSKEEEQHAFRATPREHRQILVGVFKARPS